MKVLKSLKQGDSYAVHTGKYAGEIIIFVKEQKDDFCFLAIPVMENKIISKAIFNHACKHNIVKYVERVPVFVQQTVAQQFTLNENDPQKKLKETSVNGTNL